MRVRPETRDRLNALARRDELSMADFLERLVQREEENRLLDEMNASFEKLRSDPVAWAEYQAEAGAWDGMPGPNE